MSVIFLVIKLYPFFGISLGVFSFDLMRSFKRKGDKLFILMGILMLFFFVTTLVWLIMRGDKNAEIWYNQLKST